MSTLPLYHLLPAQTRAENDPFFRGPTNCLGALACFRVPPVCCVTSLALTAQCDMQCISSLCRRPAAGTASSWSGWCVASLTTRRLWIRLCGVTHRHQVMQMACCGLLVVVCKGCDGDTKISPPSHKLGCSDKY